MLSTRPINELNREMATLGQYILPPGPESCQMSNGVTQTSSLMTTLNMTKISASYS